MNNCIYIVGFLDSFEGIDVGCEEVKAFTSLEKANAYCDFLNKKFLTDNELEPGDVSDEWIVLTIPLEND
jgi:hypothetical protein